ARPPDVLPQLHRRSHCRRPRRPRSRRDARSGEGVGGRCPEAEVRRRHERRVRRSRRRQHREGLPGSRGEEILTIEPGPSMPLARPSRPLLLGLAALLTILALAVPLIAQSGGGTLVFIGTYSSPASKGIYVSRLDASTGALS